MMAEDNETTIESSDFSNFLQLPVDTDTSSSE